MSLDKCSARHSPHLSDINICCGIDWGVTTLFSQFQSLVLGGSLLSRSLINLSSNFPRSFQVLVFYVSLLIYGKKSQSFLFLWLQTLLLESVDKTKPLRKVWFLLFTAVQAWNSLFYHHSSDWLKSDQSVREVFLCFVSTLDCVIICWLMGKRHDALYPSNDNCFRGQTQFINSSGSVRLENPLFFAWLPPCLIESRSFIYDRLISVFRLNGLYKSKWCVWGSQR